MSTKPSIALANGTIITAETVELLDSGVLKVDDGEKSYFLSPAGWWSYEPGEGKSAYEDRGLTTV